MPNDPNRPTPPIQPHLAALTDTTRPGMLISSTSRSITRVYPSHPIHAVLLTRRWRRPYV